MKYYLLIPILFLLALADLNGQAREHYKEVSKQVYETVLYEDGSYFIGQAVEENKYQVQFVLLSTKDTITLEKSLIVKWINSNDFFMFKGGRYHKKHGIFNTFEYGFGANELDATAQFEYIRGKLVTPRLGVGLGVGMSISTANSITWSGLPFGEIFLYSKYYLNDNRRRLFLDGKIGAAIPLESTDWLSYTAGPLLQPGIGFEFARSKKCRWSIKLSQFVQYTTIRPDENINFNGFGNDFFGRQVTITDRRLFNRTVIGLGINF